MFCVQKEMTSSETALCNDEKKFCTTTTKTTITITDNFSCPIWLTLVSGFTRSFIFFPSFVVQSFQPTITENALLDILSASHSEKDLELRLDRLTCWNRQFDRPLSFAVNFLRKRKENGANMLFYTRFLKSSVMLELYSRNPVKYDHGQSQILPSGVVKLLPLALFGWLRFYATQKQLDLPTPTRLYRLKACLSRHWSSLVTGYLLINVLHLGKWFYTMNREGSLYRDAFSYE